MPHVFGTIGHVDHGKSSLIEALCGVHPDRLPEEKARGMTIELGFGQVHLPSGRRAGLVDVPGHERFVRSMVGGTQGVDAVLLVVDAREGVRAQTREHVQIATWLGVTAGILVLTKIDLLNPEERAHAEENIRKALESTAFALAPRCQVSVTENLGIPNLLREMDALLGRLPERRAEPGEFRLWTDRAFLHKGHGLIVTGTVLSGTVRVGQVVHATFPQGIGVPNEPQRYRVKQLEQHGSPVSAAVSGERSALNLVPIDGAPDHPPRFFLLSEKSHLPQKILWASLSTLDPASLIDLLKRKRSVFECLLGTVHAECTMDLLETEAPDKTKLPVRILLKTSLPASRLDAIVLRRSDHETVAGGQIVFAGTDRHLRRSQRGRLAMGLRRETEERDPELFAKSLFALALREPVDDEDLLLLWGPHASEESIKNLLSDSASIAFFPGSTRLLIETDRLAALRSARDAAILKAGTLPPEKRGLTAMDLQVALHPVAPRLTEAGARLLFQDAMSDPRFRLHEGRLLPAEVLEEPLSERDRAFRTKLLELLHRGGLQPPFLKELASHAGGMEKEIRTVLQQMTRGRLAARINDEYYLELGHLESLQEKMRTYFRTHPKMDVSAFKSVSGLTRKHAMPLLEYFDRSQFTMRIGDNRILREANRM